MHSLIEKFHVNDPGHWGSEFVNIPLKDIHALIAIYNAEGAKLKDIRAALDVPNSTMTGILDRLEKYGFIKRSIDPADRRSFGLNVTKKGKLAVADHARGHETIVKIIASRISESELKTLLHILVKIEDDESEEGKL